jgi:hypothetical protein
MWLFMRDKSRAIRIRLAQWRLGDDASGRRQCCRGDGFIQWVRQQSARDWGGESAGKLLCVGYGFIHSLIRCHSPIDERFY